MGKHVASKVPADVEVEISTEELDLETRREAWSGNIDLGCSTYR